MNALDQFYTDYLAASPGENWKVGNHYVYILNNDPAGTEEWEHVMLTIPAEDVPADGMHSANGGDRACFLGRPLGEEKREVVTEETRKAFELFDREWQGSDPVFPRYPGLRARLEEVAREFPGKK